MRIIHWTDGFRPRIGGIETLLYNLASSQRGSGDTVMVVTERVLESLLPHEYVDGIEVHRRSFGAAITGKDMAALGAVVRETAALLRSFQPDVVHLHASTGQFSWLHALTRRSSRAPSVVTVHTPRDVVMLPEAIVGRVLREADCITAVSEATRRDWCGHHPDVAGKTRVVANGVPWPSECPRPLCFDPVTLLCVGRLDPMKGFDVALRAYVRLAATWPGIRLIIAGDGPERRNLEHLSAQLGLEGRVDFRGWVAPDRIAATMNEATLVLMPSRWQEPFGLVAVETAQMGRPIIASRVGGLPDCVRHDETGLLVPPEDPDALAAAIVSLVGDHGRARRLGAAAREHARARFTIERCAQDYRTIYHSLTGVTEKPTNTDARRVLD